MVFLSAYNLIIDSIKSILSNLYLRQSASRTELSLATQLSVSCCQQVEIWDSPSTKGRTERSSLSTESILGAAASIIWSTRTGDILSATAISVTAGRLRHARSGAVAEGCLAALTTVIHASTTVSTGRAAGSKGGIVAKKLVDTAAGSIRSLRLRPDASHEEADNSSDHKSGTHGGR